MTNNTTGLEPKSKGSQRAVQKQQSRHKILDAAGQRLRAEGLQGAGIAAVMKDAGLTHGAFYSHFSNKDELAQAALVHALKDNRQGWIGKPKKELWHQRLGRLAKRYLTPAHRCSLDDSCALASLSSEAGRADEAFKHIYEQELLKSLSEICQQDFAQADPKQAEEALAFMALMVGSITLSRAVNSQELSERLLAAGQNAASCLTAQSLAAQVDVQQSGSKPASDKNE